MEDISKQIEKDYDKDGLQYKYGYNPFKKNYFNKVSFDVSLNRNQKFEN
jgi:hypothetical protein